MGAHRNSIYDKAYVEMYAKGMSLAEIAKLKICLDESKQREEIARKVIDDKNREIEKLRRL